MTDQKHVPQDDTPERLKLRISLLEYELEQVMRKGKYLTACREALSWATACHWWATLYPQDNGSESALEASEDAINKWTDRIQEIVNPDKEVIPH